jgi:membrane protein insertase Oxa1/YidC/SpoIIIJ
MTKKINKKVKIFLILFLLLLTTGCTKTLTDSKNKPVRNEETGQTLTKNIICKPTNKKTTNIYIKNKVNLKKLPECKNFKVTSGKYEGLWTSFFVKPLAFILIQLGLAIGNYGIAVIAISLIIRLIAFPITKKQQCSQKY